MIPSNTRGVQKKPQSVRIETPDHFELEFHIAGIGSRFLAYFTDKLVQVGMILTLLLFLGIFMLVSSELGTGWNILQDLKRHLNQWMLAMLAIAYGVITIGYFMLFEYFWNGCTPGKRWQNIRVVRRDGRPLSFLDAAVRNILRFIDVAADFYPIGLIVMFLDPMNRRLGDMAAGTLVILDRELRAPVVRQVNPEPDRDDAGLRTAVAGMTPETYQLVTRFLARREGLEEKARWDLGIEICERILQGPFRADNAYADPEEMLEKVEALYRERTRIL
jgi:uncharacterized RDD family membrane protein YckC